MNQTLYLIRHGEVEEKYRNRYVGRLDAGLSKRGRKEAAWAGRFLKKRPGQACWCSPKLRARQTARIAFRKLRNKVLYIPDLREIDFGRWEGMTFEEIRKVDPKGMDMWFARGNGFKFPGGERIRNFHGRIRSVLRRIRKSPCREIIIVAHGGWIRAALCMLMGLPLKNFLSFDIRYASTAVLKLNGKRASLLSLYSPPKEGL